MSTFSLGGGEVCSPVSANDLELAIGQVGVVGGALLCDLPDEIIHNSQEDPRLWARRVSGLLMPAINRTYPGLITEDGYSIEGRRQTHHRGAHIGVHQDPPHRNTIFFGFTGDGGSAEFRLTPHIENEPVRVFDAEPQTMWLLGGSKLFGSERTGGRRGGTWHEVGIPQGSHDRYVSIGSIHARNSVK